MTSHCAPLQPGSQSHVAEPEEPDTVHAHPVALFMNGSTQGQSSISHRSPEKRGPHLHRAMCMSPSAADWNSSLRRSASENHDDGWRR